MRNRLILWAAYASMLAATILTTQVFTLIPTQDIRCGAQGSRALIWSPWARPNGYDDKWGIMENWIRAHNGSPCPFVWTIALSPLSGTEYFPRLQFLAASTMPIQRIRPDLESASTTDLRRRDKLGRTVLHWLVSRRVREYERAERATLVHELVSKGLSLDEKDEDGLTPRDWARSAGEPLPE